MTVFELSQLVTRVYNCREASYGEKTHKYHLSHSEAVDTVLRDSHKDYKDLISFLAHSGEAYEILSAIIMTGKL